MMDNVPEPELIDRLSQVFENLKWSTESKNRNNEMIFDKFCEMLLLLQDEQQDLILKLTEDFFRCNTIYNYYPLLAEALSKIPLETLEQVSEAFVIPLIAPEDIGKAKSSTEMLYSCANETIPKNLAWRIKVSPYTDPNLLRINDSGRENALIILVDDFIGSGETARRAYEYYRDNIKKDSDKPIVVALIGQEGAIIELKRLGIEVVVAQARKRGISDSNRIKDIEEAKRMMEEIEDRLNVAPFYRFGYGRSEALVALIKTPDNTFPVFWFNGVVEGQSWPAPFVRDL
jgi:hypothetical protein